MSVQASVNLKGGFDMINSRKLDDLIPVVHSKALLWLKECEKQGHNILITSTFRDFESQNALYALGRTKPGRKVTNAKAGQSFHNYRVALLGTDFRTKNGDLCNRRDSSRRLHYGGNLRFSWFRCNSCNRNWVLNYSWLFAL